MIVWRLCKEKYARTALDGVGAAKTGNRWNEVGVRIAYTSSSLSLAVLEMLVHVDPSEAPDDLVAVPITVPPRTPVGVPRKLPRDWRAMPAPGSTAAFGSRWARRGRTLLLKVPSVIVEGEFNYLVNPAHTAFPQLVVGKPRRFTFDARLL